MIDSDWERENSELMFIYNLIKPIKSPADSITLSSFWKSALINFIWSMEALSHVCKCNTVRLFIAEWLMTCKNEEQKESHLFFSDPLRVKLNDTVGNHITYKVNSFSLSKQWLWTEQKKKSIWDKRDISSNIVISEAKLNLLVVKLKQICMRACEL